MGMLFAASANKTETWMRQSAPDLRRGPLLYGARVAGRRLLPVAPARPGAEGGLLSWAGLETVAAAAQPVRNIRARGVARRWAVAVGNTRKVYDEA
jgi:hypothetical protein